MEQFNSEAHKEKIKKFNDLWDSLVPLSKLAFDEFEIDDIFQDNEGKVAQQLTILGFDNLVGREGNDGKDSNGVEWEMKSVNINKTMGISTHHHLNSKILNKYRRVPWSFALYEGVILKEIYVMHPQLLEDEYFTKWEEEYESKGKELNNKKINVGFVRENGLKVYEAQSNELLKNPIEIYDEQFMNENIAYDFSEPTVTYDSIAKELITLIKGIDDDIVVNSNDSEDIREFKLQGKVFAGIELKEKAVNVYLFLNPDIEYNEKKLKLYTRNRSLLTSGKEFNAVFKISAKNVVLDDVMKFIIDSVTYTLDNKLARQSIFE